MIRRTVFALSLGLGLALGLLWLLGSQNPVALADPGVLYVAPGGDCGGAMPCYATIQDAVDAASAGDEIRVATGTYAGVSARAGVTQTVYISKTVTIRGGYTPANWTFPDPAANPTTLNALGLGRVMVITDTIAPTVEGLRITGGDATELGGGRLGADVGGGMYVYGAAPTINNCVVYSNTASTGNWGFGGGLCLRYSAARLNGNIVQDNTASTSSVGYGGGLYLYRSAATLSGNTVQGNTACTVCNGFGGGLYLSDSAATLSGNTVQGNTASTAWGRGGGVYLSSSSDATLRSNTVISNTATYGGGLYLWDSGPTLTNTVIADNQAMASGSCLYVEYSVGLRLLHTTIARNSGGDGSGVYVIDGGSNYSTVAMINTIIVSHTVGITVAAGNTATLNATLWHGNTTDRGGAGTINHSNDYSGNPAFVNPAGSDYHIGAASVAIDKGVDAGVTDDIDGDTRPWGAGYDIGADEYTITVIYLPIILKKHD